MLSHYKLQSSRTAALMPRRYVHTVQVRLEAHPSKTCSAIFVGKPKQEMTEHVLRVCFPDTFTHARCIHVYIHARSAEPETPYTDNWTQPQEQKSLNHRFEELTVLCWTWDSVYRQLDTAITTQMEGTTKVRLKHECIFESAYWVPRAWGCAGGDIKGYVRAWVYLWTRVWSAEGLRLRKREQQRWG